LALLGYGMTDASDLAVSFGQRNFGHCDLGDARRTKRLVGAADQILAHPDKALPHKFASPKDYRVLLRLVNSPPLSHSVVLAAHAHVVLEHLRGEGPDVVVLPSDTTELDFSGQNTLALGPLALLSVVAVPLVNLRVAARQQQRASRPASEVVDPLWVKVLSMGRHQQERALSVKEFTLTLARLGGHQNRKCDGMPGWQTLWRGWERLHTLLDYELSRQTCGKH
jgi:Transposase DNA-binding